MHCILVLRTFTTTLVPLASDWKITSVFVDYRGIKMVKLKV
jgi:hypothetical protein